MSDDMVQRARLVDALKQEFAGTLDRRVDRYLEAKHHPLISNTTFAAASAECVNLFRDGHFYGCISLCQAVGEALLRFMCDANSWRPAKSFEEDLRALVRRNVAGDAFEANAQALWARRDDYHHLNPSVETDLAELESIALSKIRSLADMEGWVFAFTVHEGKVRPERPQYWKQTREGKLEAFLHFSP